jgi:hypothetical protein
MVFQLGHGASVIRVNTTDGRVDIFEFDPAEWLFKRGGHDIAIVQISGLEPTRHNLVALSQDMLLTQESAARLNIGPGDDVFMIGRFVDHDGGGTNVPAARFGNISVMPQPVPQPNQSIEPSFILDVHSRTGYSGSPVFVYRTIASDLTRGSNLYLSPGAQFLQLLGIHWGQFPERWEIERDSGAAKIESSDGIALSGDATYIKGLSGMTMAAPAWAIQELLDLPKLKDLRAIDTENQRRKRAATKELPPIAESETSASAS